MQEIPIIFTVHSLGGLVCKTVRTLRLYKASAKLTHCQVLLLAAAATTTTKDKAHLRRVADQTRGIVFLGTPHGSSSPASWGTSLASMIGLLQQPDLETIGGLENGAKQLNILQKRLW